MEIMISNYSIGRYGKIPKNSNARKFAVITLKVYQGGFILE